VEQRRPAFRARYPTCYPRACPRERQGHQRQCVSNNLLPPLPAPDLTRADSGPTHAPPPSAPPPSNTARTPGSLSAPHSHPRRVSSSTPTPRLPPPHAHRRRRQWRLTEARPWPAWRGDTAGKWRRRGQRRSLGVAVGPTCNGGDW
jgi:hypothetical protein